MFVYLSKKIAIPNNTRLNCISWNKEQGYIAVGGDDGLLKVLKLEQASSSTTSYNQQRNGGGVTGAGSMAIPSNLSMNQTLEGHKTHVHVVTWNETQQKLTTSDKDGVIMVWMMYKGAWYEEMTNDRKKSIVKGMSWTSDGQKICIVYEDGAIIVGSSDGNRIWGKELKNTFLTAVQWSPDGRLILFSLRNGELHLYDNQGTFVMKLNVQCVNLGPSKSISVIGLTWFHGPVYSNRPSLAVCYENGKMQLMRNENDDIPIIIDTQLQAVDCLWNHDGTILAVCGMKSNVSDKETNQVLFYSAFGIHLRTLKIPGKEITALSWEGRSLRIALAIDSFIYFANIRPDYMWCYFNKTVVYLNNDNYTSNGGNASIGIIADVGATITFWDTISNQCFLKQVETTPLGLAASQDHCVIAIEYINILPSKDPNIIVETNFKEKKYQLLICNSISTTVDSKYIEIRPHFVTMNSTYVIIASKDNFLLWHYHTPKGASTLHSVKGRKDKRYHIDDTPSGVADVLSDLDKNYKNTVYESPLNTTPTKDPICCITASEKILLIGRESGVIHEYSITNVALRNRHQPFNNNSNNTSSSSSYSSTHSKPYKMAINSNSSRAAIIDASGILTTIDLIDMVTGGAIDLSSSSSIKLNNNISNASSVSRIERKDVWAICWAKDNPHLLASMEKTRMYVLRGADPEEPISCSGYICNFEDLEITGVLLDEIINNNGVPDNKQHLLQLRVKSLRDTEELLTHVGITEAKQFIEDNPHPRLWQLLAEATLNVADYEMAENAFVRCTNYPGIQLIKRLRTIQNEQLQRAEIAAFFGRFDEAEKLYIDADRRDLAISLRQTLCDWFRTVQLYRMGPGISDQQMEIAWHEIGDHFSNLRSWESAKEYYEKAHHIEGLMDALYNLEQYDELEMCIGKLSEKNSLLGKLGQMLASVGMCDKAVNAYLKLGDVKSAVNTCVNLKQWGQAVELAQKYKMPQISTLLGKHATQLLQDGRLPEAIELQRKAGRYLDAARLMTKLAEGEIEKQSPLLRIKKIYILAGLLAEEYLQVQINLIGGTRLTILTQLSPEDITLIEQIWHCASGYHFLLLAQRQLRSGLMHSAVLTTLRLREYEDILDIEIIYNLMALASCADRSFGICSKAFIKLESLDTISDSKRQEYEELAVNIFSKYEPYDDEHRTDRIECFTCETLVKNWSTSCINCGTHFPPCIASGKSLMNPTEAWQCKICHHCASPMEISNRKTCPLCHSVMNLSNRR